MPARNELPVKQEKTAGLLKEYFAHREYCCKTLQETCRND
jgi:hypothetical protein